MSRGGSPPGSPPGPESATRKPSTPSFSANKEQDSAAASSTPFAASLGMDAIETYLPPARSLKVVWPTPGKTRRVPNHFIKIEEDLNMMDDEVDQIISGTVAPAAAPEDVPTESAEEEDASRASPPLLLPPEEVAPSEDREDANDETEKSPSQVEGGSFKVPGTPWNAVEQRPVVSPEAGLFGVPQQASLSRQTSAARRAAYRLDSWALTHGPPDFRPSSMPVDYAGSAPLSPASSTDPAPAAPTVEERLREEASAQAAFESFLLKSVSAIEPPSKKRKVASP